MKKTLNIKGRILDLSTPKVMGILNITPDSFFEGSRFFDKKKELLKQVEKMITDGVDILDIGGYSTRPNATEISVREELRRVIPIIDAIKSKWPESIISIDTFRAEVAQEAILNGADIINDISGGDLDPDLPQVVATTKVPYIIMHTRGTPQTMDQLTDYSDIILDVLSELQQKVIRFEKKGIKDIIIDPGFGFAKTLEQNYQLLNKLTTLNMIERPILVGVSRKSMIWKLLNISSDEALNGTTALNMYGLTKGASIIRVHDVKEGKQTIDLYRQLSME